MAIRKQITVWLENKPGQLAKLGRALKKGKVNILAISVLDSADSGLVRLVVDDHAAARKALKSAKCAFSERDVVVLNVKNVPGAMGGIGAALAKAGLNLEYAYGSAHGCCDDAMVVLACDDTSQAAKVLG